MSKSMRRNELICIMLVLPALLIRAFTALYPILRTFFDAFHDINLIRQVNSFTGLGNFSRMLTDLTVASTISFSLWFTLISVIFHILLGVPLALLLNRKFFGRKILRSVVIIPWALPTIAAGIAFFWGFDDMYGFVNDIIRRFAPDFVFHWLVNRQGAQAAVIIADVWKNMPFFAILILSGLQSIPDEVIEAAKVDGANAWRRFWSITLPHIMPLLIVMTIFTSLWRLTSFDLVFAMTSGGPGAATSLLAYRIYVEAFMTLNFGYAGAISTVLFLTMVIIATVGFSLKKLVDYEL